MNTLPVPVEDATAPVEDMTAPLVETAVVEVGTLGETEAIETVILASRPRIPGPCAAGVAVPAAERPGVSRRRFLALAGGAAAAGLAPRGGGSRFGFLPEPSVAASSTALVGGAVIRPPSVPLAVRSTYLSTWLPSVTVTGVDAEFWDGAARGLAGLVLIDGRLYRWFGVPLVNGSVPPAMSQTSLEVTATRSIFTMEVGGVRLVAEWLSPVEAGDLRWQSAPLCLLNVSVVAIDGKKHAVKLYADITGEWASNDPASVVEWHTEVRGSCRFWSVQLADQDELTEYEDMAQWGTLVWGHPLSTPGMSFQAGSATAVRDGFANADGALADFSDRNFRQVGANMPVFAYGYDAGEIGRSASSVSFALGHIRTPAVGFGANLDPLAPLWTNYWTSWKAMLSDFVAGRAAAHERAVILDARIQAAAHVAGGPGYAALCALAVRQAYGGGDLVVGADGAPWLLIKEISSDSDVSTVDMFSQNLPLWQWLDPGMIPLYMAPILNWSASDRWQSDETWAANVAGWKPGDPKYCPHCLNTRRPTADAQACSYPKANGQYPSEGEVMPVEESSAMLIMAAAYARVAGDGATSFLEANWSLWEQWATYLLGQVPFPRPQLTTDDWLPKTPAWENYRVPRQSVNLGLKALIGLAAAGQIAERLGRTAEAAEWTASAEDNAGTWAKESIAPSGDHLLVERGAIGTWSTLYNAWWQSALGVQLVPDGIAAMQATFYRSRIDTYGMPLQTNSRDETKAGWQVFTAAWLVGHPVSQELISRCVAYLNATPWRLPWSDRYNVTTALPTEAKGSLSRAHPSIGAVFALLVSSELAHGSTT